MAVVGSTGSIGTQCLDVIRSEPGRYDVVALAARASVELLACQAKEFRPAVVGVTDPSAAAELEGRLPAGTELVTGEDALAAVSAAAEVVVNGVVGFAGLSVSVTALRAGKRLALANKESIVAGGPVVRRARATPGAEIVPVDSEHCAIHQCLRAGRPDEVARLVLTASGGPFRGRSPADLATVTIAEALDHPTWAMGPKNTVDSSTLMNKGNEVIEAHELFDVDYDRIEVVVHPQSVVHSMVDFSDGATIAQLSSPDMRLPLAYALAWPERAVQPVGAIDWAEVRRLDFEPPDLATFPCLALAYEAGRRGGSAPAWLNAANEVAVEAFLDGNLRWSAIAEVLEDALSLHDGCEVDDVDAVVDVDRRGRAVARQLVRRRAAA